MVNVKRYIGKTAREALAALKADLGPDAVVLSNRQVEQGVEIVAMPADQMHELSASVRQTRAPVEPARPAPVAAPAPAPAVADDDGDFTVTLGQHIARLAKENQVRQGFAPASTVSREHDAQMMRERGNLQDRAPQTPVIRPFNPPRVNAQGEYIDEAPVRPAPVVPQAPAVAARRDEGDSARVQALEATNAQLMNELSSIRGMLERQLAGFAWSEMSRNAPARVQMMSELLEVGFSAQLARSLTEGVEGAASFQDARNHVKNGLNRMLPLAQSDADIIDRGGVYALVGPTGVGKTTTTAKLAARCVVRHGADKLALITTDGYRIGAHEQLRIYGRILGVTVHVVRDAADLRQTLQDLRKKHLILIDTIGMSQRDKMVVDQVAMLTSAGNVRRLLVLNATVRGDTLDDVVAAYDGPDLAGCILSKVDETSSLAPALDVAIRHELRMYYIANGQRVPEDLHAPNKSYLVHRAMRELAGESPFKLDSADAALLMSIAPQDNRNSVARRM
ncbi:flagellar biosynthesis protein FlhF [Uliginosibacterium gangwonense]|uniref:flagellar biosynthesis protein FlhF n=1 Tax=Uliginosibacterium gangwonense TaxID=392736 RepID=UPI00036C6BE6|nr:flagellar biosynthesis protein FlhF [Uliginosibacterium gangwonense]